MKEDKSKTIREVAEGWFKKAENDLITAEAAMNLAHPPTDTICFHAQQCAEKYLKGFLVVYQIYFEKSHSIEYLLSLCAQVDKEIQGELADAKILSVYAVEARYPDFGEISIEDMKSAVEVAKKVKSVVLEKLKDKL